MYCGLLSCLQHFVLSFCRCYSFSFSMSNFTTILLLRYVFHGSLAANYFRWEGAGLSVSLLQFAWDTSCLSYSDSSASDIRQLFVIKRALMVPCGLVVAFILFLSYCSTIFISYGVITSCYRSSSAHFLFANVSVSL